mgnify:CR=1 FL=1
MLKPWNKPLIYHYLPEELKEACITFLRREGLLTLDYRIEELRTTFLVLYDTVADIALLEVFGKEFIYQNSYSLYTKYELFIPQEEQNLDIWTKYVCNCYISWILICCSEDYN